MATPYLQNLVRIQAQFKDSEGRVDEYVTYWLQATGGALTNTQLTTIQTDFNNAIVTGTPGLPWVCSTCHYIGCNVQDFSSNTGLAVNNTGFSSVAGGGGSTQAPRQVAILISLGSNIRFRGGLGSMYLQTLSSTIVSSVVQTVPSGSVNANHYSVYA
jgi:hypothetical protein